jgi:hypothetical protein
VVIDPELISDLPMLLVLLLACAINDEVDPSGQGDAAEADADADADTDADGDADADADGDADTDPVEYETYSCGWEKRDPGTLSSTGSAIGDVLAKVAWTDQCGEDVSTWDMHGKYFIMFLTAAW